MELIRPTNVGRIATSAASSTQLSHGLVQNSRERRRRKKASWVMSVRWECTFADAFPSKAVASQLVVPHGE